MPSQPASANSPSRLQLRLDYSQRSSALTDAFKAKAYDGRHGGEASGEEAGETRENG